MRAGRPLRLPPAVPKKYIPRSLATAVETLLPLANPPYRNTLPSSFATSSKVTLDAFPVGDTGVLIDDDPIASFGASDQDLINAILLSSAPFGSPYSLQWTSTIDPAFAFLCLRRRSTYVPFLRIVWPYLKRLHEQFQPSTVFQLLVTDLLLWNPDKRGLGQLLELEAVGEGHLRSNHIASIFNLVKADLLDGALPTLSRKACMLVSKALIAEDEIDMLPEAWRVLFAITPWQPEGAWALFNIILHIVRRDGVDVALPLVQLLVERGLVHESAFGKSNRKHPKAKVLLVQSVILRCCLEFKLYVRAQRVGEELVDTMESSEVSSAASELLLETCRATISGRNHDELAWAGDFMERLAKLPGFPTLPASLVNAYMESVPSPIAVQVYLSLPQSKRPTPSPQSILALAAGRPTRTFLLELMPLVSRIPPADFIAQRPAFLGYLAEAGLPRLVRMLYPIWKDTFTLNPDLMLSLVRCFASAVSPPANDKGHAMGLKQQSEHREDLLQSAHPIITDFERYAGSSLEECLALIRAKLLVKDLESAQRLISRLDATDSHLAQLLDSLATEDIAAAIEIVRLALDGGNPLGSIAAMISRACAAGRWDLLLRIPYSQVPTEEKKEIRILESIRKGKVVSALQHLGATSTAAPTTYLALVSRAISLEKWGIAINAWTLAVGVISQSTSLVEVGKRLVRRINAALEEDSDETATLEDEGDTAVRIEAVRKNLSRLKEDLRRRKEKNQ